MHHLIKEFHRLFALYKKPEYLEIAATLGKVKTNDLDALFEKTAQNMPAGEKPQHFTRDYLK